MGKPFVLNWCMHMERTHTLGMAMAPTLRQNINHNDSFQIKNTTTNYNEYQLNWTERYFSRKNSTQIRIWNDGCLWDTEITSSSFQWTHINHWCWRCYVWKSNTNQWQCHGIAWHQRESNEMKWNEWMNEWNKLMMMKLMLIHHLHEEIRKTVLFSWVRLTIQLNSWKQSEKWLYYLILGWRNQHQHQHHIIKVCEG